MKSIHFLPNHMMDTAHPINIILIGAGGTGSNIITQLAKTNHTLKALNHPGITVTTYDPDVVTAANVGRQLFSPTDIGEYKAEILTYRINQFFGTDWKAINKKFNPKTHDASNSANIYISAVDSVKARRTILKSIQSIELKGHSTRKPYYWMDTGNSQTSGQIILSSIGTITQPTESAFNCIDQLPNFFDHFPTIENEKEDNTPSCSVYESLRKQDLFINSLIAQYAAHMIWKLLRDGFTLHNGLYLNLDTLKTSPIKFQSHETPVI